MAQISADFELGTNGNSVLPADAGSATAWDTESTAGASTRTYSDAVVAHGGLSMKLTWNAASETVISWTTALGTVTDHYGRFYLYMLANPSNFCDILRMLSGGSPSFYASVIPAGTIALADQGGNNIGTTTNALALNQKTRIEYHIIHSVTVGQVELKLFNSAESTTPTETLTTAADKNLLASADEIRYGIRGGQSSSSYYYDDIVANATSYPGPVITATANLAPVIFGRGAA